MQKIDFGKIAEKIGSRKILQVLVAVVVAFGVGYYLARDGADHPKTQHAAESAKAQDETKRAELWTCAMHPQIKLPNPGKCPICYMDLIPLESEDHVHDEAAAPRYSMSETAKGLAQVETTEVKREKAAVTVRMVGLVYEDETRVAALTSRVDGRLDQIYITFTGVRVNKGDPMVMIWSPTLIKSQVELFETIRSTDEEESVIKGAEEKLIQYGLTQEQVNEIKEKKKPILNVTLRAPISGIVTKKMALLGQFVKEGTEMYLINDLSHVWIKMDAYETDLPWIKYGQEVTFTTPAVPGRKFQGKVLFIDPTLDMKTRSVKVRVEAENPDYSLKPGMFVTAEVQAEIDSKGRVIKPEWAGKYVCPIHPRDEASSAPGTCPESKMPLQPSSTFGYVDDPNPQMPLLIPASAALVTGKRAVVYVEVPEADRPTYEGREVVLGPKAGDKYVVYSGLKEGERVVSQGNFKIDSAMQILAKPSMMSPSQSKPEPVAESSGDEEVVVKLNAPESFLKQLTPVIEQYLILKEALVAEKSEDAAKAAEKLANTVKAVNKAYLDKKTQDTWNKQSKTVVTQTKILSAAKEIEKQRKAFDPLSDAVVKIVMGFRHVMKEPLYVYYCADALDRQGAYWIEAKQEPRNPYFGDKKLKGQDMLKCGELSETIPPENFGAVATSADSKSQKTEPNSPAKDVQGSHPEHGGEK